MTETSSRPAVPQVFDRMLLRRRLARAHAIGIADFLLARVTEDMSDRLSAVLRSFAAALDLGTPSPLVTQMLASRGIASVVQAAPVAEALSPLATRGVVVDEEDLPFAPESFDLVVSALSLQHVNDLPGTLVQIRRSLKPDGLFLGCLVGGQSLRELRAAFAEAEEEVTGGASPRVAPFADLRDLGGLLQRAGLALPVTDIDSVTVRYGDLFGLARDLRAMGAGNALVLRDRRPLRRSVLMRAAQIYAERHADEDGRIRATFEFIWMSGWAPHESQQKPLQPGTAKMRWRMRWVSRSASCPNDGAATTQPQGSARTSRDTPLFVVIRTNRRLIMLTRVKMALAGTALLVCALPASANAQSYYYDNYGYAPSSYGYTYSEPYAWGGPTPFWPVNAAAGIVGAAAGAAANVVSAPFVGWRDGYYVDQRIDPVRYGYNYDYGYGYGPTYRDGYAYGYGYDRPNYYGGWNGGYVATYRGKVHAQHHATRAMKPHGMRHAAMKHKARNHMAAR